ncbi:MAG: hypothetical protein GQ545_09795, partial [Candidatus Aminicenantes bacterium]|nr:hypothetical protein [Candidatus Aminicenantes bacterium]
MKGLKTLFLATFVLLFLIIDTMYAQNTSPKKTVLTNCVVIDCTDNLPMEDMTVIIAGNTIEEIKQGMYHPTPGEKDVRVFNLKGAYVLPGLWNMHVHLSDLLPDVHDML